MILGNFELLGLGVVVALLTAPALAQAPAGAPAANAPRAAVDVRERVPSRRVELPFPLESRPTDGKHRAPAAKVSDGPHPYREIRLQRASLDQAGAGTRGHGLRGLSHGAELG